jgi:hypothetical protein
MANLLNWLYSFINKAIWVIALLSIFSIAGKPLTIIINNPEAFSRGSLDCLYYLPWILTTVLGIYFTAKIISKIIEISEPIIITKNKNLKNQDMPIKQQFVSDKSHHSETQPEYRK